MYALVSGSGQTILLLHGWGGSHKSLMSIQNLLVQKGFRTINVDLPGFGESQISKEVMSVRDYVTDLKDFLDSFKPSQVTIIGHSFGGKLAMAFTLRYPDLVKKLILINAAGVYPRNEAKKTFFKLVVSIFKILFFIPPFSFFYNQVRKLFYKLIVRESDYINAGKLKKTFQKVISEHFDDQLANIKQETLVIWAENDSQTPLWQGKKIAETIPNSQFHIVTDAGHGLPLQDPKLVTEIILPFLTKAK